MNDTINAPTVPPPPRELHETAEEMRRRAGELRLVASVMLRHADTLDVTAARMTRQVAP